MPVLTKINTNVIADNAVTAAKLPTDAIGATDIAADAVGSSELADDAVLPANISHLGDGTGKLSGTITGQQLRLGTAFTLTDDLTVNGDVTLGKVGDDSTGQSLTQDSSANRTLTGTGTLRMGSSLSSVDGMTGTLGKGVTGGAGLTVTNTPAFRATLSSATSGLSASTWTKISCGTVAYDTDSVYTGGTFTVPSGEGGNYVFYGHCYFQATTVSRPSLSFYVGGTRVFTRGVYDQAGSVHGYPEVRIYAVLPVSAGVAVEFYAYTATASVAIYGTSALQNQPACFGGFKIGA